MRVLMKEPGKDPHVMVIPNDLRTIQQLIDGYIEPHRLTDGLVMIIDEEGKLKNKQPNFFVAALDDIIVGNAIFCGENEVGDDFDSIQDGDLTILQTFFSLPPSIRGGI